MEMHDIVFLGLVFTTAVLLVCLCWFVLDAELNLIDGLIAWRRERRERKNAPWESWCADYRIELRRERERALRVKRIPEIRERCFKSNGATQLAFVRRGHRLFSPLGEHDGKWNLLVVPGWSVDNALSSESMIQTARVACAQHRMAATLIPIELNDEQLLAWFDRHDVNLPGECGMPIWDMSRHPPMLH